MNRIRGLERLTIALVVLASVETHADTHHVDPAGSNTPPYTSPATAAHVIQDAIDAADAGDTVEIAAGTYSDINTRVNESVTIVGAGVGLTIIEPTGAQGFYIDVDDVSIRDLTIRNGSQAIRFDTGGGTIDNTTLDRVSMEDHSSRGIEIHNLSTVTNLTVRDCNFERCSAGLRVSSSGHLDGAEFRDTVFLQNNIGLYHANDGGTSTLANVLVTGCRFQEHAATWGSQGTSIFLEEAQNVVIEENEFVDNRRDIQIFKWYQASVKVSNLAIRNNTMTGTTDAFFAIFNREHTTGQTEFDGVTFENNDCSGSDASGVYAGAHSGPSLGGIGWDTVEVHCNNFLGITSSGRGVRFFLPGVAPGDALAGASIDVSENYWGTSSVAAVEDLMQVPSITIFEPIHACPVVPGECPPVAPSCELALRAPTVLGPAEPILVYLDVTTDAESTPGIGARLSYDAAKVSFSGLELGAGLPASWSFVFTETGTPGEVDLVVTDVTPAAAAIAGPVSDLEVACLTFTRIDVNCDAVDFGFNAAPPDPGAPTAAFPENQYTLYNNVCDGTVETCSATVTPLSGPVVDDHAFVRGNINTRSTHTLDISDVIDLADYLFVGTISFTFDCEAAFDTNNDGAHNITDLVTLVQGTFNAGVVNIAPPNYLDPGQSSPGVLIPGVVVPNGGSIPSMLGCEDGETCP